MVDIAMGYSPRSIFVEFHKRKHRWACLVAHRRCGKTVATIADLVDAAGNCDKVNGRFAYIAPFYKQAKTIAWQYLKDFIGPLVSYGAKINESELTVTLPNGAQVRLYGADNPDALRGIYLDGVVLDEYADCDPQIWTSILIPALADRKGWAVFIGTPKGHNAFYDIWQQACARENWFALMLRASETGLLDQAEMDMARSSMTKEEYAQEFECSFDAAIKGAFYGDEIERATQEGRFTHVPFERGHQVVTAWDLGFTDATAIWFVQQVGRELHFIDYYEADNRGLDHYAEVLRAKGYLYVQHLLPHDVDHHEIGSGRTRAATLRNLGITPKTVPVHEKLDGINAARLIFDRCWFDTDKCARGIEALKMYRREWDEKGKVFRQRPLHDWTSHAADAFRYFAAGFKDSPMINRPIDAYRRERAEPTGSWMSL